MTQKSTRTMFAASAIALLILFSFAASQRITTAATPTGVIVPLYTYPGNTWDRVIQAKNAHPSVPIVIIIDPADGPGSFQDPNYVTGIQNLRSAGITVIGYVDTLYGARSTSAVIGEIDKYKSWYPALNGIFFDEMSYWAGDENYYRNVNDYANSKGLTFTVGNPGTDVASSYIGIVDNIIIYETTGLPSIGFLGGWHTSYDKSNFSIIPFAVSTLDKSYVSSASNYVGYIYITNDNLPNPWDSLPPYFEDLVATLDTGSITPPPPSTQVSLMIQSVDLSGNPITGHWTEISTGGSIVATGFTPFSYTATAGTSYTVCMADWLNFVFDHWNDGSTGCKTITPTQNTVLTAYYQTGATAPPPDTTLPSVSVTSPASGATVSSMLSINVSATDNVAIDKVELYVDNALSGTDTTNEYSFSLDTTGLSNGSHTLLAKAYDTSNNSASSSITVNVSNFIPPPTGLTATAVSATQINLTWTAPTGTVTGYKIERESPIGGGFGTIVANTGTAAVTYSDTGLTQGTVYNYRVSAINSAGTSNPSNEASATTLSTSVSLTVKTVNLAGTAISGLWTEISEGGSIVATGFTPFSYTATAGTSYTVCMADWLNFVFDHWNDGSTGCKTITPTQNTVLTAYYKVHVSLKIKSVDLSGTPIIGLWTEIYSNGELMKTGWTTLTYTASSGTTYTVCMANWQNYVFDHWGNGSTNSCRTITPTQNTVLTAYYQT